MVEYDMRVLQPSRLLALLQALDAALPQPHNMVGLFLFGGGGRCWLVLVCGTGA